MKRGGIRKVVGVSAACLAAVAFLPAVINTMPQARAQARAQVDCAVSMAEALRQAQAALERRDVANDREALVCMIAAVSMLDARLRGLSDGSIPFDGQIHAPKGWVISKPPTEEAD